MKTLNIGFVIFPKITQLDFTGPLQVMCNLPGSSIHIVAKTMDAVPSDSVLKLLPTCTFETCPPLDIICVPGGIGIGDATQDPETVAFVRQQGEAAKYVTSVCTGAFLLGAAGLLRGKRATTHWAYIELLELVGATYTPGRVVRDGNVTTAGGVTSGIDFGFDLVAQIAGREIAEKIQLMIEYDPAPPFDSGNPERASQAVKTQLAPRFNKLVEVYREGLKDMSASWG